MVDKDQPTTGAQLVDIRSLITPVQTVAKTTGVATNTQQDTGDFMDKILKGLELVNSMMEKGDKLEGMFTNIAERKGIISREENKPDNPALASKRETTVMAQDAPEKQPPSVGKPILTEQTKVVYMPVKVNEEYVKECVAQAETMLKEKLGEEYKDKTVGELMKYLDMPLIGDKIRATIYKELLAICKQSVANNENDNGEDTQNETSE